MRYIETASITPDAVSISSKAIENALKNHPDSWRC